MRQILFLSGAGGSPEFWQPGAMQLPDEWAKVFFGCPGLGDQSHDQSHDPGINSVDDLVRRVESRIDGPVDLVAQSMGGVIAARIALNRTNAVRRLVLVVTSAGVNMAKLGASDWRADYQRQFPRAARWILQLSEASELRVEMIEAPTLPIWGDSDPIGPIKVGLHLERRMPNARLHVIAGGDHGLASNKAKAVATLIVRHLR